MFVFFKPMFALLKRIFFLLKPMFVFFKPMFVLLKLIFFLLKPIFFLLKPIFFFFKPIFVFFKPMFVCFTQTYILFLQTYVCVLQTHVLLTQFYVLLLRLHFCSIHLHSFFHEITCELRWRFGQRLLQTPPTVRFCTAGISRPSVGVTVRRLWSVYCVISSSTISLRFTSNYRCWSLLIITFCQSMKETVSQWRGCLLRADTAWLSFFNHVSGLIQVCDRQQEYDETTTPSLHLMQGFHGSIANFLKLII